MATASPIALVPRDKDLDWFKEKLAELMQDKSCPLEGAVLVVPKKRLILHTAINRDATIGMLARAQFQMLHYEIDES